MFLSIYALLYFYAFLFQVALLGMDIVSVLVTRLQNRFKPQIGTGENPCLLFSTTQYLLQIVPLYFFLHLKCILHE